MTASDELEPLDVVLRRHGLVGKAEEPFPNDGWSGASLTRLRRGGGDRFILKRDSLARDWIARATNDGPLLREAWLAGRSRLIEDETAGAVRAPYVDVGQDGDDIALLMPDLTGVLFDWERPISIEELDRVLFGLARLHAPYWSERSGIADGPWCPLRERIALICRRSLEQPGPAHDAVAERLLPGWDAFDRRATPAARHLLSLLNDNVGPLLDVLVAQDKTLIHGDLKLANVGIAADGAIEIVDWQMVSVAPIAVEIGWFLVANVASLPVSPEEVLFRYQRHLADGYLDPDDGWMEGQSFDEPEMDAAILVGLLLRGWRKGLDADAGITLASGVSAADDLAWWCERAVEAADRLL
jgi:hypothetical protein